jgi:hypothetical protein
VVRPGGISSCRPPPDSFKETSRKEPRDADLKNPKSINPSL